MESGSAEIMICNSDGLSARILNLYCSQELCDVQLQVGNNLFDAHKLILCASSDVFKTMLTNQKWPEAHKQVIELVEEPACEAVFGRFMHYIYSGQLYLSHSTVNGLLTLADKYNIKEMIPLCRTYMMENLDAPVSKSCVLQWWEIANMRNDKELEAIILSYIECNFNKVIRTSDFVSAHIETVEKLLVSSKLAVHNEATIFCGVMIWLQAYMDFQHPPMEEMQSVLCRLTQHIRWPMMTANELCCLHECPEVQRFVSKFKSFSKFSHSLSQKSENVGLWNCCFFNEQLFPSDDSLKSSISRKQMAEIVFHNKGKLEPSAASQVLFDLLSPDFTCENQPIVFGEKSKFPDVLDHPLCMSRVYINDYWCTSLTVSDFLAFPQYGAQIFFFSTPKTGYRCDFGHALDWEVELSPKGVHYPPAILIGLERDGNKLVDESFIHTVRLSVMSQSPQDLPLKVEVDVLVRANSPWDKNCSFIERCHRRTWIFDSEHQRHNMDDIVPYDKLGAYLRPSCLTPDLNLTPTAAFTLYIVLRPLPLDFPNKC